MGKRNKPQQAAVSSASDSGEVGVCVLNWNSGTSLASCVESILATLVGLRIVVIDNASSDSSVQLLRDRFPEVPVIRNKANLGYAAGNNVGASHLLKAGCSTLVFINPDVIVKSSTVKELVRALVLDPAAGCVGGIPETPPGKFDAAARTRPTLLEKTVIYGPLWRVPALMRSCGNHLISHRSVSNGAVVHAVYGACIAFRSSAFLAIGGFDPNTFLYEEEFIVAVRLEEAGWKTVLCTSAKYSHAVGGCTDLIPYKRRLYFIASEQYLLRRYYRYPIWLRITLRLYRYTEWLIYCSYTYTSHRISRSRSYRLREVS